MIPLTLSAFICDTLPRRIVELLDVIAGDAGWRIGSVSETTYR